MIHTIHVVSGVDNVGDQPPAVKSQEAEAAVSNKLPLPLPLAIRNLTSQYYKQQDNVKTEPKAAPQPDVKDEQSVGEAKVMRRDILADQKPASNTSQQVAKQHIDARNKDAVSNLKSGDSRIVDHDRMKRDTLVEEMLSVDEPSVVGNMRTKDDQNKPDSEVIEKCDIHDKDKTNLVPENPLENYQNAQGKSDEIVPENVGELPVDGKIPLSIESDKNPIDDSNFGSSSNKKSKLTDSDTQINPLDDTKTENVIYNKSKSYDKEKEEFGEVFTLSSLIRTPSHLSEPKISDADIQNLKETAEKMKDSSIIPKPMARDLKSVSSSTQKEENDQKKNV